MMRRQGVVDHHGCARPPLDHAASARTVETPSIGHPVHRLLLVIAPPCLQSRCRLHASRRQRLGRQCESTRALPDLPIRR
jgi:hypothetical protein